MSIIKFIVPIEDDEPWQQIFIDRTLTDDEFATLLTIDAEADCDGNSDSDSWLNVSCNPGVEQYLKSLV